MSRPHEFFALAGNDYLLPALAGRTVHLSVSPDFVPVFQKTAAAKPFEPGLSWSTHAETRSNPARPRAADAILVLDSADDVAAQDGIRSAIPRVPVRSAVYDAIACRSVGVSFEPRIAPPALPPNRYFILCAPRTGSYFLCDLLRTSKTGMPDEHLRPAHCYLAEFPVFDSGRFLTAMASHGGVDGIFGTKIISSFFRYVFGIKDGEPASFERAAAILKGAGFKGIYLRRENTIAQAVSKYVAEATSEYQVWENKRKATTFPPYDAAAIKRCLGDLAVEEARVAKFFAAFGDHLTIRYEDLDSQPLAQLDATLAFLGRPRDAARGAHSNLTRQRSGASDAYAARFRDEMAAK